MTGEGAAAPGLVGASTALGLVCVFVVTMKRNGTERNGKEETPPERRNRMKKKRVNTESKRRGKKNMCGTQAKEDGGVGDSLFWHSRAQ